MQVDQPSPMSSRNALVTFRRAALGSLVTGGAAVLVLALLGQPLLGLYALLGIALGAGNGFLMYRSLRGLAAQEGAVSRKRVAGSSLSRLGVITAVALAIGIAARPQGLAVFFGLAFFQITATATALIPQLKNTRSTEAGRP